MLWLDVEKKKRKKKERKKEQKREKQEQRKSDVSSLVGGPDEKERQREGRERLSSSNDELNDVFVFSREDSQPLGR